MAIGVEGRNPSPTTKERPDAHPDDRCHPDPARVVSRPIRPDDSARLRRLFYRLSPKTLYRRFFSR